MNNFENQKAEMSRLRVAQDWLARIESMHPSEIDLGLDRMAIVAQRLGLEPDPPALISHSDAASLLTPNQKGDNDSASARRHVITVAGTNGKGSTVRALEALCLSAGVSCAAYTSPHLADFGERLRLNGVSTKCTDWVPYFERVEAARVGQPMGSSAEHDAEIALTFFEFTSLAAFLMLTDSAAQVWIMEIGLGGRLDAVNWLNPTVAIVTRIAQDHAQWLGASLPDIAREKCGIFREGRPALWADAAADVAVRQTVVSVAKARAVAQLYDAQQFGYRQQGDVLTFYGSDLTGHPWSWSTEGGLAQALGAQLANSAIDDAVAGGLASLGRLHPAAWAAALQAFALIAPDWADIYKRVWPQCWQQTRLPGRFDVQPGGASGPKAWIYDVAHNADALLLLTQKLQQAKNSGGIDQLVCVFGVMSDKPWQEMIEQLLPFVSRWILVQPETPRSVPAEKLLAEVVKHGAKAEVLRSRPSAWCEEVGEAAESAEVVLVCGSFFTVGSFYTSSHSVS